MITDAVAARLAVVIDHVMAMRLAAPGNPTPPVDARLDRDWQVVAYVVGWDRVVRAGEDTGAGVSYGVLAVSRADPAQAALFIRGTNGMAEWLEDAQAIPVRADVGGLVHRGMFGIYASLRLFTLGGRKIDLPFALAVVEALDGRQLTVVGHSLGGPLATYAAAVIAPPAPGLSLLALCSPKPGDAAFADWFEQQMTATGSDYLVVDYEADLVPRMPPLGYAHLRRRKVITRAAAKVVIKPDIGCNHHAVSIAAMLDPTALQDETGYGCIAGRVA